MVFRSALCLLTGHLNVYLCPVRYIILKPSTSLVNHSLNSVFGLCLRNPAMMLYVSEELLMVGFKLKL
ncbi:hypothetical protein QTP88_007458 [Uroleucon formosanum]